MTFEEFWKEVENTNTLPETAIQHIPMAISEKTKRRLMRRTPEEAVKMLNEVIEIINQGSVEKLDTLLSRK